MDITLFNLILNSLKTKYTKAKVKHELNIFLSIIKYENILDNTTSLMEIVKWCKHSTIRYDIVELLLDKSPLESEFKSIKSNKINSLKIVDEYLLKYNIKHKIHTKTCLIESLPIIIRKNITGTTMFDMFNRISFNRYVTINHCYELIIFLSENENLEEIENFKELYKNFYTFKSHIDLFKSESSWKKELIDKAEIFYQNRLRNSSAYPESSLKAQLDKDIRTLRLLEDYIKQNYKNYEKRIDAIRWFLQIVTIDEIKTCIISIGRDLTPKNEWVKSSHSRHHAKEYVNTIISLFKYILIDNVGISKGEINSLSTIVILNNIPNLRESSEIERRNFEHTELSKINEEIKNDKNFLLNELLFTILQEAGLRVSALVSLKLSNIMDDKLNIKDEIRILEKGNKMRTFPVSDNLKLKLNNYINHYHKDIDFASWLFPSTKDISKHISQTNIREKLKKFSDKAGVFGKHIHPHAFRHTIVTQLMQYGNKIENVSKYMGHSSVATTEQYYWTPTLKNIIPLMNIPWIASSKQIAYPENIDEIEDSNITSLSIDLLVSVLSEYHNILTLEQKKEIKNIIPNIEDIFNAILDYSETLGSSDVASI